MSHAVVNLTERTFALLLGNVDFRELIKKLEFYINNNPIRGLQTSFDHLKNGSVSLLTCCKKLEESKTEELADEESEHARLQKELQLIKECDQYKTAVKYFKKANGNLAGLFKVKDETQNNLTIKITATKVLIISEILGNLTNLTDAVQNCEQHILKLHESLNAHSADMIDFVSIMLINMKVFDFMKEFTAKPVVMLDWPTILGQKPQEKFHPILGGLPRGLPHEIPFTSPDPFTHITDVSNNRLPINSCIAAITCHGDIFARAKASTDLVGITKKCDKWYSFNDDIGKNINIVSIAIDCADCKTSTDIQVGESSTQPNPASPGPSRLECRGKMYVLAWGIFERNFRFFLYVINMNGTKEREEELGFLERRASTNENPKVKIFCINDKKVVVLDVGRRVIHICDKKGMEKHTIDATAFLTKINVSRPPIFTGSGEIICLASTFNFFSKINIYDIVIGEGSSVEKTKEINIQRAVQAAAFDHKSNEIIILCYNFSLQYYLMIYSKEDGKLIEDIKLHNGKYREAGLIFNSRGPIALLDDFKLLSLK